MGKYVRDLLTEQKYFATILPRIPVPVMRQFQIQVFSFFSYSNMDDGFLLDFGA